MSNHVEQQSKQKRVTKLVDEETLTTLGCECPAVCVDILAHIIILGKVEELPDLGRSLGAPHPGLLSVSQAWKVILTLLDDDQVNDGQVLAHNATSD
jgi:hypothetical protein